MEEIYKLRQAGKTWREIQELLESKITITGLCHKLKRWCEANNIELNDGRKLNCGRPKKEIKFK